MRRFRAPERDCLEVEEEETTAVIFPQLDLLRGAHVVGGERRRPRLGLGHGAALGLGFLRRGKKEGERSKWSRAASLSSMGGQGARGARGGHGITAAMAPVLPLAPQ